MGIITLKLLQGIEIAKNRQVEDDFYLHHKIKISCHCFQKSKSLPVLGMLIYPW
jgi:hypothetical protein